MRKLWLSAVFVLFLLSIGHAFGSDIGKIIDIISKVVPLVIPDKQIGSLFKSAVDQKYGIVANSPDLTRIQQISGRLLPFVKDRKTHYDFAILNNDEFNACSVYGGHIRVNRGLLHHIGPANNELAFILAHEISHQDLGHNYKTVQQFRITAAAQLMNLDKNMPFLLKAGLSAVLANRSRQFEKAADYRALEMMKKAGFNLTGGIAAFRRIEAEHRRETKRGIEGEFSRIFASHPEPAKRVAGAEDYLFSQKYGRTFRGDEINSQINQITVTKPFDGAVIIVAHPSLWQTPLRVTTNISGVGLFNPSLQTKEEEDVVYYINLLRQGQMVAACGDNDSHELIAPSGLKHCYTFIDGASNNTKSLLDAIKNGRTYASAEGTEIRDQNFAIGQDYPRVKKALFNFRLVFPKPMRNIPNVKIFRQGELIAEIASQTNNSEKTEAWYTWEDQNTPTNRNWYVLYAPGQVITSPITIDVTRRAKKTYPIQLDWQKVIIHCHSRYSDGRADLSTIQQSAQNLQVQTIFMTDHDDCFRKNIGHLWLPHKRHRHYVNNPYNAYAITCRQFSQPNIIPGFEYTLPITNKKIYSLESQRHILVLNQDTLPAPNQTEEALFNMPEMSKGQDNFLIMTGPYHLGDDRPGSEIHKDKVFTLNPQDLQNRTMAFLKIQVKGTPRKDPILWINRQEIGRIVTNDDKWREYQFGVNLALLRNGKNLFHIQAYIPDLWQTFDDCEFANVRLIFQ